MKTIAIGICLVFLTPTQIRIHDRLNLGFVEGPLPAGCSGGCPECSYCADTGHGTGKCTPLPKCSVVAPN